MEGVQGGGTLITSVRPGDGKVAVVTGGTRGIGLATAKRLARDGYSVMVGCRGDQVNAEAALAELTQITRHVGVTASDISTEEGAALLFSNVLEQFKRVDVLVNNAGITDDGPFPRMDLAAWNNVINTNLTSAYLCSHEALPIMSRQRYGRIVMVTSVVGRTGNKWQANYAAAKAGLIGLTTSLAREYGSAKRDITVNAVAPGFIDTRLTTVLPEDLKAKILGDTPLGRFGTVDDIAGVIAFLVSPAANFMTGAVIDVNGGLFMG